MLLNTQIYPKSNSEKPLVVVTCSYNNAKWCQKNLDSIFSQNYQNFRVICVDDCSTDGTGELIEQYIKKHRLEDRITLIRNNQRLRKMANIYKAIHLCRDKEIVIQVDGDDWLAHDQVFKYINNVYKDPKVWLTYGQYRNEPKQEAKKWGWNAMGYSTQAPSWVLNNHKYRKHKFIYMHLRTFYAWLFKQIRLEDLVVERIPHYRGQYYPVSNDVAMMLPMVEMAHKHVRFISDVLYIRNVASPLVGFKIEKQLQGLVCRCIRKKTSYRQIYKARINRLKKTTNAKATVIIFASSSSKLYHTIKSICKSVQNIEQIMVFYKMKNNVVKRPAQLLDMHYSPDQVRFIPITDKEKNIKQYLLSYLEEVPSDYVVITSDTVTITQPINLNKCIRLLEQTFAYAFYLTRGGWFDQVIPSHIIVDKGIYAWKFMFGEDQWNIIHDLEMTLFRKSDVINKIKTLYFDHFDAFEHEWNRITVAQNKIGLFYKNAKVRSQQKRSALKTRQPLKQILHDALEHFSPQWHVLNQS